MINNAQCIGLLGGSFNPAHAGHVHVSNEALKRLGLSQVWWLVSPQNPLKAEKGMAPYEERFASAVAITDAEPNIVVSDFEKQHQLRYTYATIRALKRRYPGVKFVWLMGADNLATFHRWQNWREIARLIPIAVFDRAPFSHSALHGKAALTLANRRLSERAISTLVDRVGHWAYILMRRHAASSTALRK